MQWSTTKMKIDYTAHQLPCLRQGGVVIESTAPKCDQGSTGVRMHLPG